MEEKDIVQEEPVTEVPAQQEEQTLAKEEAAPAAAPATTKEPFSAKLKEWWRKKIVALKRKPQTIPLILLLITSVFYLLCLQTYSETLNTMPFKMGGFSIFINTLFSILILVLFLNTFPKNKKMNIVMLVLVCVFFACLVVFDIVLIMNFYVALDVENAASPIDYAARPYLAKVVPLTIVHLVLLGIFALAFALMPVYAKLIRKIDTSKQIEGGQLKEAIDTEDE